MRVAANWWWLEDSLSERPNFESIDAAIKEVRMHENKTVRNRSNKILQQALLRSIQNLGLANATRDERCILVTFFAEVIPVEKMLRTNDSSMIVQRGKLSSQQVLMLALQELSPEIAAQLPVKIRDYLRDEWAT